MSTKVLPFTPLSQNQRGAPLPNHTAPAGPYVRLNVVDDLYAHMGFFEGAIFVAQAGKVIEGYLHYIELDGYGFLGRLTDCTESAVYVIPLDRETPPGAYSRTELDFVGVIVEHYPRGLNGSRWILSQGGCVGEERPLFEAIAN
jgi:hypothetical protein